MLKQIKSVQLSVNHMNELYGVHMITCVYVRVYAVDLDISLYCYAHRTHGRTVNIKVACTLITVHVRPWALP